LWDSIRPILGNISDSHLTDNGRSWKYFLLEWNGHVGADDQRATLFEFWMFELARLGKSLSGYEHWGSFYFIYNTIDSGNSTLCGGDCSLYATNAFQRVLNAFGDPKVPDLPKWGSRMHMNVNHLVMSSSPVACLFDRRFEFGGDRTTVNVAGYSMNTNQNLTAFEAGQGASYRQIVDLADLQNSVFVLPGGQSGNVLESQYDNLLHFWRANQYVAMKTKDYKVEQTLTLH